MRSAGISIRYDSSEEWAELFGALERIAGRKLPEGIGYIIVIHPDIKQDLRGATIEIDVAQFVPGGDYTEGGTD